jgi:hypothetical protein
MSAARARPDPAAEDPISQFFAVLAAPGHLATFEGESATLRFDLADGQRTERWHVTVADGDVSVSRESAAAEAIVRMPRPVFEAIVTGRRNAQAAMLRGLLTCEGSVAALIMFQRCLPGPPGSTGRVAPISSRAVMEQRRPA